MTRVTIVCGALAIGLFLLALAVFRRTFEADVKAAASSAPAITPTTAPADESDRGFLYGRILTKDATYEGRLRFGGNEEAFWGDFFNGSKDENHWVTHAPPELFRESRSFAIFGVEIAHWEDQIDLSRPFMARFGDIVRIEPKGGDLQITLKSGTVFHLDRFGADDLADGVRVWDGGRGAVDLDEWAIHTIELLPTARLDDAPSRLRGIVRARQGTFTGFIQWNRLAGVGTDELKGRTAEGKLSLRFDTIRAIARTSDHSSRVTLLDDREIVLSGAHEVGDGNRRGIYVDDARYGRVLVSWDAFERIDFSPGDSGPAYGAFPPGRALKGCVTTHAGRRLTGRLVYDLDESETTETLDAPSQGVDYMIPFDLIASIVLLSREASDARHAMVTLQSGEELQLERTGDLGKGNAGMLIFVGGDQRPEYVPWTDIERVDLDAPGRVD